MRPMQVIAVVLMSLGTVIAAKWGLERLVVNQLAGGPAVGEAGDFRFANYWYGIGRTDGGNHKYGLGRGDGGNHWFGMGWADAASRVYGIGGDNGGPVELVNAARMAVPATVQITAGRIIGSGAILSNDGYIVTNSHVLADADEVSVTLTNRKTLKAKIVGADATTDLAVLKIDAANLPFLLYGNSDDLKVGQWVMAIGYPLGLQVTATAGIISGKGRWIDEKRTEMYLQTDAAVNLGNSGGPLVNPAGQIVGINTAIASPNGVYTGYSFAVPVNTVRRIVGELIKNGRVIHPK